MIQSASAMTSDRLCSITDQGVAPASTSRVQYAQQLFDIRHVQPHSGLKSSTYSVWPDLAAGAMSFPSSSVRNLASSVTS